MNPNEIDDGLTPEERAAIESDDDIIEDDGTGNQDEGNDDAGNQEDGGEAADDAGDDTGATDGDAAADAAGQAAGEGADDAAAAAEQPAQPAVESAPLLVAQAPEDADAKLAEIASKKEALLNQFDDGDITAKEYQLQLDALMKDERQIELALHEAQLAAKMEQQRQQNEWTATVNGFIQENPRYNPQTSPRLYQLLDMEVRAVASTEEFRNRTDSAAGRLILQRAHENLAKELGFEAGTKPAAAKTPAKAVPKPDLPPSLHSAPAAESNDVTGGKWAQLDRLASSDPIAYEDALMKMSERDREAYLSA